MRGGIVAQVESNLKNCSWSVKSNCLNIGQCFNINLGVNCAKVSREFLKNWSEGLLRRIQRHNVAKACLTKKYHYN